MLSNLVSLVGKFEKIEENTYKIIGRISQDTYCVSLRVKDHCIPLSSSCEYTLGDITSEATVITLRAMTETSWGKFESNPDGTIIYRIINYKTL